MHMAMRFRPKSNPSHAIRRKLTPILLTAMYLAAISSSKDALPQGQQTTLPWLAEEPVVAQSISDDFRRFDSNYVQAKALRDARLEPIKREIIQLQDHGKAMACSQQLLVEAQWVLTRTADWSRYDALYERLQQSLSVEDQDFANQQSARDGAWGQCYDAWFLRLDATVDALNALAARGTLPKYPLRLLKRIVGPEQLTKYLDHLLVSDIAKDGVDRRAELAAATAAISQLLFKPKLRQLLARQTIDLASDDQLRRAYFRFLNRSQDKVSGYWGAFYRSNGRTFVRPDLSMTFHAISYLKGDVANWPSIIDTLFASKDLPYPTGWMHNGQYNHHNNYDVATILRYGWRHMSSPQKEQARLALESMLNWCLTGPADADPPFAVDPSFYDSVANYYYFGVSFLDVVGYWDRAKRFWTTRDFPGAQKLCRQLKKQLLSNPLQDSAAATAIANLDRNCPG